MSIVVKLLSLPSNDWTESLIASELLLANCSLKNYAVISS